MFIKVTQWWLYVLYSIEWKLNYMGCDDNDDDDNTLSTCLT